MYYVPPKKSRSKKKSSDDQAPTVADDNAKKSEDLTIDNEMAAMAEELDELDTMPFESDGSSDAFF
jgi:hypothetical protein